MNLLYKTSLIFACGLLLFTGGAQAKSLVSLKPNITKTLMALGETENIAGITKYCSKPNSHAQIIADYLNIDVEAIVRLKPDVVISSRENSNKKQYESLERAGFKIDYLPFHTVGDLLSSIEKLGTLLNIKERARSLVRELQEQLTATRERHMSLHGKKFIIIVQRDPLIIASGSTFLSTLLESVGLNNSFHEASLSYPVIDAETFLRTPADFIFTLDHGPDAAKPFLGKKVTTLKIDDFIASPDSITHVTTLMNKIDTSDE